MSPQRFQHVKEIVTRALERSLAERKSFIARICKGDGALQKEVESLLEYQDGETGFSWDSRQGSEDSCLIRKLPQRKIGPYRIDILLGRGGMGEVYRAWDERLARWVVLKRLSGDFEETPKTRSRFLREARSAAQLSHPAVVQVFDILENGDAWIVMELVSGPTLAELLRDGPVDIGLTLEYGRQIALGLEAAHQSGVIHRDLKTENVMLVPSVGIYPGQIKIVDFGLASRGTATASYSMGGLDIDEETTIFEPGQIMGTPRAMSPEHARGIEIDARSDLFSLGVLLYELSTGRSPFKATNNLKTMLRVVEHHQPPARKLNPRIPQALSDLIDLLLEKDPERRPQGAVAVAEALARIAAGSSIYQSSPVAAETTESEAGEIEPPIEEAVIKTLLSSELIANVSLMEVLDDHRVADVSRWHERLVQDLLVVYGGLEIYSFDADSRVPERTCKSLIFDRPWAAVRYALEYHEALQVLSDEILTLDPFKGLEVDFRLVARVGIYLGEIILRCDRMHGERGTARRLEVEGEAQQAVIRLRSLARPDQTLLSRVTFEVAWRGEAGQEIEALNWIAHGSYRFKGSGRVIEVFEVGVSGVAPLQAPLDSGEVECLRLAGEEVGKKTVAAEDRPSVLRSWASPELPEFPYPVLLPYSHPALFAGREQEIEDLRRLLRMPLLILGLSAGSGTGKSSLLLGGLVPELRAEGKPVAVVRHPCEAGIMQRLLGDLLEGDSSSLGESKKGCTVVAVDDWQSFVERLCEVELLAGEAAILVVDQFEDVLRAGAETSRTELGVLMAATALRRPGIDEPPCRWLLACRQDSYGQLISWLSDVLDEAQTNDESVPRRSNSRFREIDALPHDLSQPERFHSMSLLPLATPQPHSDALMEATRVFQAVIEKPLQLTTVRNDGVDSALFPWRFVSGHARRLAQAFAEVRILRPEAPLTTELQVVLAHLLSRAEVDVTHQERVPSELHSTLSRIEVPEDPGVLVEEALEDHLRRALETAFPSKLRDVGQDMEIGRARALLALRELANTAGRGGLSVFALSRAIGENGQAVLEQLAAPPARLVVQLEGPVGWRYMLAHDRMAEVVIRMVEREGQRGKLLIDGELLALRRVVALETALHCSGEKQTTRLSRRQHRLIDANTEALLWDEQRRAWWAACRSRQRSRQRRATGWAALAILVLALTSWGAWNQARLQAEHQALLDRVVRGEPEAALRAVYQLAMAREIGTTSGEAAAVEELWSLLRQRKIPMDVLEHGLVGMNIKELSAVVLQVVELALMWVEDTPEDSVLIANLLWALDYGPARDPSSVERAATLRNRVLEPLRRLRLPPLLRQDDSDWIEIPAGSFLMGADADEGGRSDEFPQHEVSVSAFRILRHEVLNADYRMLIANHEGEGSLPAVAINWYEAYTYAGWLGGRLPTEAEWEYAARASCPYSYCTQEALETTVDQVAWTVRNSRDRETREPILRPVMQLETNPWGLFDMLGSVWEWTADWRGKYPSDLQHDPWGPGTSNGGGRVVRGGCYAIGISWARAANRDGVNPGYEGATHGFRVVMPGRTGP